MTEILFWKGIISPREDLNNFKDVIGKLLRGEYKAADLDLKKCRGLPLFSVRVNKSDRILLTSYKGYLIVVGVIYNHDYQKNPFLNNPALLKPFIEKLDIEQETIITEANFQDLETEESETFFSTYVNESNPREPAFIEQPVFYFNERFISFNPEQEQAAQAQLPVIISGAPGSGKSCVALSFLASASAVLSDDNTQRKALYIARSPFLVEQMHKSWSALPESCSRDFKVEFKTYEQLLLTAHPHLKKRESCDAKHFERWFTSDFIRQTQNRQQLHAAHNTALQQLIDRKELIYQELRVASGYEEKDYVALGQKQSLFQDAGERAQLYAVFKAYNQYLNENNYYDPAFCDLPLLGDYDIIVADEGQDLSLGQLEKILELAGDNLFICYDPNQSLGDAHSIRPCLKAHYFKKQINISQIDLFETYRCLADIADFASGIVELKQKMAGRSDKNEAKAIIPAKGQKHRGEVRWLDSLNEADRIHLVEQARHPHFAIVTSEAFKAEAAALFNTPLIFTPAEIKGLEYPFILVYRLMEGKEYVQINKALNTGKHIDKRDLRPAFNALFTAVTRAQATLYIYQPPHHPTAELIARIKEKLPKSQADKTSIEDTLSPLSSTSPRTWTDEHQRQLKMGNTTLANTIEERHLSQAPAPALLENVAASQAGQAHKAQTRQPNPRIRRRNRNALDSKPQMPVKKPVQAVAVRLTPAQEKLLKNLCRKKTDNFIRKVFMKDDVLKLLFERNPLNPGSEDTLFGTLMAQDESYEQLHDFLQKNPQFTKKLTFTLLNKPCKFGPEEAYQSHLFHLIMTSMGQKIVKVIFETNPDIPANLPPELLFTIHPDYTVNFYYALHSTLEGIQCLRILLNTNKNFIERLDSSDFLSTCKIKITNNGVKETPFRYLARALLENEYLLNELIEAKPELLEGIKASDLFSMYTNLKIISPLETIVYLFAGSLKGIEVLHAIFSKNKALSESEEVISMFKSDYHLQRYKPSAFSILTTKTAGIQFLSLLFSQNPRLIQAIKPDDFFKIYSFRHSDNNREDILTSSFSMLCKRREGFGVLHRLLSENSDLLHAMTFEHVMGVKGTTGLCGEDFSYNNLISLMENNYLDVIELILKTHPEFIKRLEPHHLDIEFKYTSPNLSAYISFRGVLNLDAFASIKALIQSSHPALLDQKAGLIFPFGFFSPGRQDKSAAQEDGATHMKPY